MNTINKITPQRKTPPFLRQMTFWQSWMATFSIGTGKRSKHNSKVRRRPLSPQVKGLWIQPGSSRYANLIFVESPRGVWLRGGGRSNRKCSWRWIRVGHDVWTEAQEMAVSTLSCKKKSVGFQFNQIIWPPWGQESVHNFEVRMFQS